MRCWAQSMRSLLIAPCKPFYLILCKNCAFLLVGGFVLDQVVGKAEKNLSSE